MSQPNVPFGLLTNRSVRLESWDMEYATNSTSVNAPPAGGGEQAKRWAPCAATPRFGTPLGRTDKHQRAKRTHGPVAAPDSEVLAHLVLLACPAGFAPQLWQHVAALSVQCHQLLVRLPRIVRTARFIGPDSWHCLRGVVTRGDLGECPPSSRTGVSSSDPLSKSPQKPTQKQEQLSE